METFFLNLEASLTYALCAKINVSLKMFFLVPACGWVKVLEIYFLVEPSYLVKRMASPQEENL